MGVGLHLLMVLVSVNFLAEASTGDADYETELLRQYLLNRVPERLLQLQHQQQLQQQQLQLQQLQLQQRQRPLFTYKFPEPPLDETFAVPPSDPRYYYLPPIGDRYENQETFERSSKLNRVNKSSMRRPYTDADNVGPQQIVDNEGRQQMVDNVGPQQMVDNVELQQSVDNEGRHQIADNVGRQQIVDALHEGGRVAHPLQDGSSKQPMGDRHSALRLAPTSVPTVQVIKTPVGDFEATREDMIFIATVAGCSAAAVVIIAIIGFGWYRLHRRVKAAADVDYPAYGVTGPNKEISPTGDRKLAENAQMYHYQHQKQQIISMSNSRVSTNDQRGSGSEAESDEENEEGDYTVYECPGLAATGEMEVKNPLFQDDPTPAGGPEPPSQPQSNAPIQK